MLQKSNTLLKSLRNIFVCKYLRIIRKLDYPYYILPNTKFKIKIDLDSLIKNQDVYILRRSNLEVDETFETIYDEIILNDDAIDDIRIVNLSVNLLGGNFQNKHNKYIAKREGALNWLGNKVLLSEHKNDYDIVENKGLIFINTRYLHNIEFPYNLPPDQNLHKDIANFQKTFGSNRVVLNNPKETIRLIGKSYFKHSPINLNYWHLELKVENYTEKAMETPKNKSDKRFLEQLFINIIKLNAIPDIDIVEKIDKPYYSA